LGKVAVPTHDEGYTLYACHARECDAFPSRIRKENYIVLKEKFRKWSTSGIQGVWQDIGLTFKLAIFVIIGLLIIVGVFGYLGVHATETSTQQTLQERVLLAQLASNHLDYALANVERMMHSAAEQLIPDNTHIENEDIAGSILQKSFQQLLSVSKRIYILNNQGEIISVEPENLIPEKQSLISISSVKDTLQDGHFELSGLVTLTVEDSPTVLASVPFRDSQNKILGAIVASLKLDNPEFLSPINLGNTGYLEVADRNGIILISSHADRLYQLSDHKGNLAGMIYRGEAQAGTCHDCHSDSQDVQPTLEVIAFSPLEMVDWGVVVRQQQGEAFIETQKLQFQFISLGAVALGLALLFAWLFTHSVTTPLQFLTSASQRIAKGDLITPITLDRGDEIGTLAKSFDNMRKQVRTSMNAIQAWNRELDKRVHERTKDYEAAQAEARQARDFLQAIIDGLSDELVVIDPDFKVLLANEVISQRWGKERNVIGVPCWVINHEGRTCRSLHCECPVERVLETGKSAKSTHLHQHRRNSGRYVDIVESPLCDENVSIIAVI